jgi:hypothetical protein
VLFPVAFFSSCNKLFIGFVTEGCGGVGVLAAPKLPKSKAIFFSGILSAAVTAIAAVVFASY